MKTCFFKTRRRIYTESLRLKFKSKVVLELLETGKSVNEIASKYNLLPKSVTTWKKQFFENASSAFEDSVSTKKYKDELKEKEQKIEELEKTLGLNGYDIFICAYKSTPSVQIKMGTGCQKKSGARA